MGDALLHALHALFDPWAAVYNDSTPLQTAVACAHVGGTLLAGGLAIAADRTTLRATRDPAAVAPHVLDELASVHRPVVVGLVITVLSGVLLFAGDLDALAASPVMWLKLGLFFLLLINGTLMRGAERSLVRASDPRGAWTRLRAFSVASLALWFAVALTGTALLNIS